MEQNETTFLPHYHVSNLHLHHTVDLNRHMTTKYYHVPTIPIPNIYQRPSILELSRICYHGTPIRGIHAHSMLSSQTIFSQESQISVIATLYVPKPAWSTITAKARCTQHHCSQKNRWLATKAGLNLPWLYILNAHHWYQYSYHHSVIK